MKNSRVVLLTAAILVVCSVGVAEAGKRKCAEDYRRFSPEPRP